MKTVLSTVMLCGALSACGPEHPSPNEFWKDGISVRFEKAERVYSKPFNFFVMRAVRTLGMQTVKPGGYEASCTVTVHVLGMNSPDDIELFCDDYRRSLGGKSGIVSRRFASEDAFVRGFSEFISEIEKKRK